MKYKEIEKLELKDDSLKEIMKDINDIKKLQIYSLYRKYLTEYILLETRLQEYDNKIKNSELSFPVINKNDMDFYQVFSNEVLNYFYIRNDLYIEQLSQDEVTELLERINSNNYEFDKNAQEFVKKTYKKILKEEDSNKQNANGFGRKVLYGGIAVDENALVLGMKFNEFADEGIFGNQWIEVYKKRIEFINYIFQEVKKEIEEKLDIPVEIIKY